MSPQLTAQQLDHAISNIAKRVEAKKLEVEALKTFLAYLPAPLGAWYERTTGLATPANQDAVEDAAENFFTAKLNTALIDLEELELNLKAMRQMRSGVVGANMVIPPFNSKRQ
jgi:hypothetical protein